MGRVQSSATLGRPSTPEGALILGSPSVLLAPLGWYLPKMLAGPPQAVAVLPLLLKASHCFACVYEPIYYFLALLPLTMPVQVWS